MESKHYDVFIGLLHLRCDLDWNIPNKPLHLALRDIHKLLEDEQSVQLSIKARDKYKIAKVELEEVEKIVMVLYSIHHLLKRVFKIN